MGLGLSGSGWRLTLGAGAQGLGLGCSGWGLGPGSGLGLGLGTGLGLALDASCWCPGAWAGLLGTSPLGAWGSGWGLREWAPAGGFGSGLGLGALGPGSGLGAFGIRAGLGARAGGLGLVLGAMMLGLAARGVWDWALCCGWGLGWELWDCHGPGLGAGGLVPGLVSGGDFRTVRGEGLLGGLACIADGGWRRESWIAIACRAGEATLPASSISRDPRGQMHTRFDCVVSAARHAVKWTHLPALDCGVSNQPRSARATGHTTSTCRFSRATRGQLDTSGHVGPRFVDSAAIAGPGHQSAGIID
jgi:hypothetical protein